MLLKLIETVKITVKLRDFYFETVKITVKLRQELNRFLTHITPKSNSTGGVLIELQISCVIYMLTCYTCRALRWYQRYQLVHNSIILRR